MKKTFIFLTALLLIITMLPAQAQMRFGVKGGLNVATIHFKDVASNFDSGNVTGFQLGPMIETNLLGLGLDAALLYSQKGVDIDDEHVKTDNLEIPINLKTKFGIPSLKIFLTGGPYWSFSLGNKSSFLDKANTVYKEFKAKDYTWGINLGGGVEFSKHLQIGAKYGFDMKDAGELVASDDKIATLGKTRSWSITAAYLF